MPATVSSDCILAVCDITIRYKETIQIVVNTMYNTAIAIPKLAAQRCPRVFPRWSIISRMLNKETLNAELVICFDPSSMTCEELFHYPRFTEL